MRKRSRKKVGAKTNDTFLRIVETSKKLAIACMSDLPSSHSGGST